jgi:hypothetical protein
LVFALSACGSSSSGGLSKVQLAAKVNAACAAYNSAVNSVKVPNDYATNAASAAAYLDRVKPLVDTEKNTITALKPDSSVKSDFDAYVMDGQHQYALFTDLVAKAHANNRAGLVEFATIQIYRKSVLAPLEMKLGFTACLAGG